MAKYVKTEQGYIDASIFAPALFKPEGKSYLTFSSPKSFTLKVNNATKNWDGTLEYFSADKVWTVWDGTTILFADNNDGEYVLYLRGTGNTKITGLPAKGSNDTYRWVLTGSDIACVGNIENLLDYATVESGQHPTMAEACYVFMFYGCTSLTQAPALPATTLANYCYDGMFVNCTSLTQAPVLPAITLSKGCYQDMFFGCTSLTQAPTLTATTLADYCYADMFYGCTSLTQAPALSATTLSSHCYHQMFSSCTSLTQTPALPATTLANDCYYYMFYDCTSLTKAPALPATTLAKNCYYGMFAGCTSLTQAPALPATTLAEYCYCYMFSGCTALTQAPALPATTLASRCYSYIFKNCTSIKLSSTKTGEYTQEYRTPTTGTGIIATDALTNMFVSTGGTFTGTPAINTTYYLSTDNMIVRDTEVATLNGYVGSMIDDDAIDKYNGMTPVECVYTHLGSQQTKIIYVEEGTLIPPSSSASDDIKNAWTRLLAIPLSGTAATGPNSSFKDLIRGIGLLADNGVFGDLLSQSGNEFICYTDIFKQDVCLHIYNSKTDDKTITVYFNYYKQDIYQQVVYHISNDTFDDYCSFNEPVKKYSSNINTTTLTMPQTEMAAAPTKDMQIATKKYVDDSVSNSLNITGARVGQIVKITAVDDNGKPTAWEAVDDRLPNASPSDAGKVLAVEQTGEFEYGYGFANIPHMYDFINLDIDGASPGQLAKVKFVDDSGKPTAWEAVDMPAGGGGETWEAINAITLSDAVNTVTINTDSGGNAIALKKVRILIEGSATKHQDIYFNNSRYFRASVVGTAASVGALSAEPFCGKMYCFAVTNIAANYAATSQLANTFSDEITITEIKLIVNDAGTFSAGTKFTIQGVRA